VLWLHVLNQTGVYNTELAIFALGQVNCSTLISVPKLGFVKILPP
jgi:hypothetical protein